MFLMILSVFSSLVSVAGLVVAIIEISNLRGQLTEMKIQTEADIEKSKRKATVEVIREWNNNIIKETSFAERIVEKLDEDQCRCLYAQTSFKVSNEIKKMLCDICPFEGGGYCKEKCESMSGEFEVKDLQLSELRWHIIHYLNNLEVVTIAWKNDVVDREIIEEQFSYLHNPEKGREASKRFRDIAGGGGSYPSIEELIEKIKKNKGQLITRAKGHISGESRQKILMR